MAQEIINGLDPNQRLFIVLGIVFLISIMEACGQTCIKKARATEILTWIFVGAFFYMGVVILLFCSYKYDGMGHINLVWSCLSIILAIMVGYYLFNEPFNRYTVMAICTAVLTIYLAHLADEYGDGK